MKSILKLFEDKKRLVPLLVFLLAAAISLSSALISHHYIKDISGWPSDSTTYLDYARKLNEAPVSTWYDYNSIRSSVLNKGINVYGKEALVFLIAMVQKLTGDYDGLYPNYLANIIVFAFANIFVYLIFLQMFKKRALAFIAFILHVFSFWPYQSILQGAHLLLCELLLLLSLFCLLSGRTAWKLKVRLFFYFAFGLLFSLMLFSSTTALVLIPFVGVSFLISILHGNGRLAFAWGEKPFWRLFFAEIKRRENIFTAIAALAGFAVIVLFFTGFNPVEYYKNFFAYATKGVKEGNPFFEAREWIAAFIPEGVARGGGIVWLFRYFNLIMPVIFPLFLVSLGVFAFMLRRLITDRRLPELLLYLGAFFLSMSPLIFIELSRTNQLGRVYYPFFVFIIWFIILVLYLAIYKFKYLKPGMPLISTVVLMLAVHIGSNIYILTNDIYPSRMVTTYLSEFILSHKQDRKLYFFEDNPHNVNFINFLDDRIWKEFKIFPITDICEVKDGMLMVLPNSDKTSIYLDCRKEFSTEEGTNPVLDSAKNNKAIVIAKFKTLASSPYWVNEEPICTYRHLMGEVKKDDFQAGYLYLLDGRKLAELTNGRCIINARPENELFAINNTIMWNVPRKRLKDPQVVEAGYRGFNILWILDRYYGLSRGREEYSLVELRNNKCKRCVSGKSIAEVRGKIDYLVDKNAVKSQ